MLRCMGRIVLLALIIIVGAVAYVTRGAWEPRLRARLGARPAITEEAGWEPVTPAGAIRLRRTMEVLRLPGGAVFVNVKAGDLVAFALDSMLRGLGSASSRVKGAEALAGENTISIRGTVDMNALGASGALGPLAGVLSGDQPIEIRGRLEVLGGGEAQYRVERIALNSIVLPSAAIGPLVRRLAPRGDRPLASNAIVFALPPEVADIRVARRGVTLYKAVK